MAKSSSKKKASNKKSSGKNVEVMIEGSSGKKRGRPLKINYTEFEKAHHIKPEHRVEKVEWAQWLKPKTDKKTGLYVFIVSSTKEPKSKNFRKVTIGAKDPKAAARHALGMNDWHTKTAYVSDGKKNGVSLVYKHVKSAKSGKYVVKNVSVHHINIKQKDKESGVVSSKTKKYLRPHEVSEEVSSSEGAEEYLHYTHHSKKSSKSAKAARKAASSGAAKKQRREAGRIAEAIVVEHLGRHLKGEIGKREYSQIVEEEAIKRAKSSGLGPKARKAIIKAVKHAYRYEDEE